jgi:hypothetical protein
MSDWKLEYNAAKTQFRINDGDGTVSDPQDIPSDGIAMIEFPAEDEEDEGLAFLVTLHNYDGETLEADGVYDIDATDTVVVEGVDFSAIVEEEGDEEEEEEE